MHDESTSPADPRPIDPMAADRAPRARDASADRAASGASASSSSAEPVSTTSDDVPAPSPWSDASDGDLILYTRAGDGEAYGELWRRHARAGRTVARSFTSSLDPDDLVQESFAKIYQALQKGGGPTGAFRPYLFTTIRNTASAWGRARREASIDTLESFEDPASRDEETMAALDRSLTATAFRSLPTRWQEVLWYCEVEQMTPQQVAPLLAMKPNAVAALAYRAREGLRQAWIQAHIAAVPEESDHRWTIERLGSYTRGSLGKRDTAKMESHLDACARCTIVAAEAKEVGSRIALVLLPLAAGTAGATGYLAWMQTGSSAALTTVAMPGAVIGGHGLSVGVPADPTLLATLGSSGAGGSGAAGSGAAAAGSGAVGSGAVGSGAVGSGAVGSGAAGSGAAVGVASTGAASAGAVSAAAATTGVLSGVIALVAAGAVAAALAFSPTPTSSSTASDGSTHVVEDTERTPRPTEPTNDPTRESAPSSPSPSATTTPSPSPSLPSPEASPDAADPASPSSPSDPAAPSAPGAPGITSANSGTLGQVYPILSGTSEAGATITVLRGSEVLASFSSDGSGRWRSPELRGLPTGSSELLVRQSTATGTSPDAVVSTRLASAPRFVSPTNGAVVSADDLSVALASGVGGGQVAGWVDGQRMFSCALDGSGTSSSCSWNTGADWEGLGLGWHEVSIAHTDADGRTGPSTSIRVFVVDFGEE